MAGSVAAIRRGKIEDLPGTFMDSEWEYLVWLLDNPETDKPFDRELPFNDPEAKPMNVADLLVLVFFHLSRGLFSFSLQDPQ